MPIWVPIGVPDLHPSGQVWMPGLAWTRPLSPTQTLREGWVCGQGQARAQLCPIACGSTMRLKSPCHLFPSEETRSSLSVQTTSFQKNGGTARIQQTSVCTSVCMCKPAGRAAWAWADTWGVHRLQRAAWQRAAARQQRQGGLAELQFMMLP